MSQGQTGWLLLLVLAIVLMIVGIQGDLGIAVAILFCPTRVTITDGGAQGGSSF